MILKITYQGQEFTAATNSEAFGEALNELFQNPNYCLTTDANNQTVAYGVDLLKASLITVAPNVQQPIPNEVVATLEEFHEGKECAEKLFDLASQLISLAGNDERYGGFGGAFPPDFATVFNYELISQETFNAVMGARSVYFNRVEEYFDIPAQLAQQIIASCPNAVADLNNAIAEFGNPQA